MDREKKTTLKKAAAYVKAGNAKVTTKVRILFIVGLIALIINCIMDLCDISGSFMTGFIKGATFGIAMGVMVVGIIYTSGLLEKAAYAKKRYMERI